MNASTSSALAESNITDASPTDFAPHFAATSPTTPTPAPISKTLFTPTRIGQETHAWQKPCSEVSLCSQEERMSCINGVQGVSQHTFYHAQSRACALGDRRACGWRPPIRPIRLYPSGMSLPLAACPSHTVQRLQPLGRCTPIQARTPLKELAL